MLHDKISVCLDVWAFVERKRFAKSRNSLIMRTSKISLHLHDGLGDNLGDAETSKATCHSNSRLRS